MTESDLLDKTKFRVIQRCHSWLPLTQTWLYNQVHHLPKSIENHIVCEKRSNLSQFYLPNIHSLSDLSKWRYYLETILRKTNLRHCSKFYIEVAKQVQASILHSHFGNIGWSDLEIAKQANLKHIVTFYGADVNYLPRNHSIWRERYQSLFKAVDLILCEGSHMAKCIVDLGCPASKVRVHHLGVSVDEIEFKPRVWILRSPLKVLIAATFGEKKGIPYALEALGQLQHKVSLKITIIGDARNTLENKREKQKILSTIEKYYLEDKVRLLGYQPHDVLLKEAYQHHIFISPSVTASHGDTEGGAPVTIIEMIATGMPIISTTHCDIPEVMGELSELLAEERDVDGLITSLNYLIDNPEKWHEMAGLGRRHIEQEYNAQVQGLRLAEIYKAV